MIKTQIKNRNISIIVDEGYSYSFITTIDSNENIVVDDIISSWSMNIY